MVLGTSTSSAIRVMVRIQSSKKPTLSGKLGSKAVVEAMLTQSRATLGIALPPPGSLVVQSLWVSEP